MNTDAHKQYIDFNVVTNTFEFSWHNSAHFGTNRRNIDRGEVQLIIHDHDKSEGGDSVLRIGIMERLVRKSGLVESRKVELALGQEARALLFHYLSNTGIDRSPPR